MSSFETDVMDDLYYDEAEGPAHRHFDEYDEYEEEGDEFLRSAIGAIGNLIGGGNQYEEYDEYDDVDEYDEYEEYDEFSEEGEEFMDAMEEAVTDALAAEDADEFFRRMFRGIRNVARTVGRVASRVAPVIGRIARTVAPIASAIPLPWTQAIGRVANVVGRVMADEADEFDALEEMYELAEYDDIDAAAPVIAGLTIRRIMPGVTRLPRAERRRIVHSVTQATRRIARRQGPQAARAIPGVVRTVQTAVRQRRIPARRAPQAIVRTAARVARSRQLTRQLAARSGAPMSRSTARATGRRAIARPGRPGAVGRRVGGACPHCRRGGRRYTLRGPVTVSIQER